MRIRGYARVSTEEQAESGKSLPAQRDAIDDFCRRRGHALAGFYVDEGVSGKSLNRPEFQRLLREMQTGDTILVHRLDRLTRSPRDLEYLLERSEKGDLYFRSVNEEIDTSTANGRFFVRMMIQVAAWERETIAERSRIGKRKKVDMGEWQGGPVPIGYVAVPSDRMKAGRNLLKLIPDPDRSHIIPLVFERYVSGYGMRAVCQWLNDDLGIRTANGARWRVPSLTRVLTNPIYCGDVVRGRRFRGEVQRVQGSHQPLVDRELFERAQAVAAMRKTYTPRQATGNYPLGGIARCGVCGGTIDAMLRRNRSGTTFYTYRCHNYVNGVGCGQAGQRSLTSVSGRVVEENLLQALVALGNPAEVEALLEEWQTRDQEHTRIAEVETDRIQADIRDAETAIAQWKRLYEMQRLEPDEYLRETAPHRERIKSLRGRLAELVEEREKAPDLAGAAVFAISIREGWEGLTPPERKQLIQEFVNAYRLRPLIYPDRSVRFAPLH